jgi:hypothetical protein
MMTGQILSWYMLSIETEGLNQFGQIIGQFGQIIGQFNYI